MTFSNISCLKTDHQTFENKQTPARTKRVLRQRKHRASSVINPRLPVSKITKEQLLLEMNLNKYDILLSKASCQSIVNWCVIGALITLITPGSAVEIEESSISINRPIMKNVPDLPGWVRYSTEYVRCFCNLPACVSTGYMCKSSGGGCFSDLLDQANQAVPSNVYRGIHGCLELLTDRDQRNWCQNSPTSTSKSSYKKKNHPRSLLLCCYRDMCNHADNPETKVLLNETALGETSNESDKILSDSVGTKQDPALYTESEVWFRAATIAVPICGAVILLALIGLAVKLLRTESSSNSNHKLGIYMLPTDNKSNCEKLHQQSFRHHNIIHKELFIKDSHHHNPIYSGDTEDIRQQTYVPLLIQTEMEKNCDRKNETNAKLNYMQDIEHCPANACEDTAIVPERPEHLFHKNTDLHVGRNMILGGNGNSVDQDLSVDKIYNKESIP